MSKIARDLSNLNESRKRQGSIIVKDAKEENVSASAIREHKGIYLMSFLLVLLIVLSAFSMSISLKTNSQLETSWADSKAILNTLSKQAKDIDVLKSLVSSNSSIEIAQIGELNGQVKELNLAMQGRDKEIADLKVAHNELKTDMERSAKELRVSDDLLIKKVTLMNEKVNDAMKYSSTILSTY